MCWGVLTFKLSAMVRVRFPRPSSNGFSISNNLGYYSIKGKKGESKRFIIKHTYALIALGAFIVDFRINGTRQTDAVFNRTYRGA